jgi:3-methyladenine DNA glycosylase AlkD
MTVEQILKSLESIGSATNVAGMERFGIVTAKAFGISTPVLKQFAKELKRQIVDRHQLALELWQTGVHEVRTVAYFIDDPKQVTKVQMDSWATDFDNWATVDGTCGHLFCRTPFAYEKAFEWSEKKQEYIKRAGFSMMVYLAVHDKKTNDEKLAAFLPVIEKHSHDGRNFVKKAVNWALRQIGKRSEYLNLLAIESAERIRLHDSVSARWIASNALNELRSQNIRERLAKKKPR